MFKVCILLALAVAGAAAQNLAAPNEAAPEPYSYAYTADSHAASEQRDPQGRVTGFYTLVDADGRERRVEYIADEAGFRAKVATNEVGTKSENPADVEINASEPTPQQFAAVYQQAPPAPQVQYQQAPRVIQQTVAPRLTTTTVQQQPIRSQVAYTYQQPQYGYTAANSGYYTRGYYAPGYAYGNGYGNGYGYGQGYGQGYGYTGYGQGYTGYNGGLYSVGNYNNHLPSQYYRSISSTTGPATYTVNGAQTAGYRYVSQPAVSTYGVSSGVVTSRPSSNLQGSSNYLVIQKRAATAGTAEKEEKKN